MTDLALSRVRGGTLPRAVPPRLLAGTGQDHACSLCTAPISIDEVEYEITIGFDGGAESWWLHIHCYHAWVQACRVHAADDRNAGR